MANEPFDQPTEIRRHWMAARFFSHATPNKFESVQPTMMPRLAKLPAEFKTNWPVRISSISVQDAMVFGVALLFRCCYLWQLVGSPLTRVLLGDATAYDRWAREIAAGDVIGSEVFYQAPLYPYFLGLVYSIVGPQTWAVRLIQIFLGSVACVLVARAGRHFFDDATGSIAGLLLAIYPSAIFFDGLIQKASLDLFLFSVVLAGLARLRDDFRDWKRWCGTGAAFGALALTRENALILVPVVLAWIWLFFRAQRRVACTRATVWFLAGLSAVLLPVTLRNWYVANELHISTSQVGTNLYIGNHAGADGTYRALVPGRGHASFERDDATSLAEQAIGHKLSPGEVSTYWSDQAWEFVRSQPGEWLLLMAKKWLLVWNCLELGDSEDLYTYSDYSSLLAVLTNVLNFGLLVTTAAVGCFATWSRWRELAILYAIVLAYAASVAVFYVFARYRFPLVPVVVMFSAAGVAATWSWIETRQWSRLGRAGLIATVAALFSNWYVRDSDSVSAATYFNLGVQFAVAGDQPEAIGFYETAIKKQPDYAAPYNNLGVLYLEKGKLTEARRCLQSALRFNPLLSDAQNNLGNLEAGIGHLDKAESYYQAALKSDPNCTEAWISLANLRLGQKKTMEAISGYRRALAIDPKSSKAHCNLGVALANQNDINGAIAEYQAAIEALPSFAEAWHNLGNALLVRQQWTEAADAFRNALQYRPELTASRVNLARALIATGKRREAIAELDRALEMNSLDSTAEEHIKRLRVEYQSR